MYQTREKKYAAFLTLRWQNRCYRFQLSSN